MSKLTSKFYYTLRLLKTKAIWGPQIGKLGRRVRLGSCNLCPNPNTISIGDHTMITNRWALVDLADRKKNSLTHKIRIGKWCRIQHDFQCNAFEQVTIGDYCLFAPRIFISDADHVPDSNASGISVSNKFDSAPVSIGDNCWLGVNVTILKGVTLGKNSIVAAGAVVTKSFPPNSIIGGVPAKKISNKYTNLQD
jgi:acetyltransferase-like isoleucine patch superfamily enzyme